MKALSAPSNLYAAIVAIGGFVFGFDAAVISGVVGPVAQEWQLDSWAQGWVVSAPTFGGIIAALVTGPLSDVIGRRKVLFMLAALYVVSAAASALAPSVTWLIAARFIGGVAFGSLMLAPIYIAEVSPQSERGRLVSFNQLNIVIGLSAAYFSNYFLQLLSVGEIPWRLMLGIELLPAIGWLLALNLVPESPRWLTVKGRLDEADAVWRKLRLSPAAMISIEPDSLGLREKFALLFSNKLRLAVLIGLVVGIAQQATGVNAIYFYAPTIFEQSGVGTDAAFAQATLVGITNVVFTVVALMLVDRLGRRPLLLLGLAGVMLSTGLTAWCFSAATYAVNDRLLLELPIEVRAALEPLVNTEFGSDFEFKAAVLQHLDLATWLNHQAEILRGAITINATLVLLGILGFVASFAVSLGPVMWVLFSEIFPNEIRGLSVAFVGFFNSMTSFVVQLVFPWELERLGAATTFGIYAGLALVAGIICIRLLPETKQRSLEELQELLGGERD